MVPLPKPVELPYFRNAAELPGPLPTREEILDEANPELAPRRTACGNGAGVRLVRNSFIVKIGGRETENEGNALLFLEQQRFALAPSLYAMYRDSLSEPIILVMEYIQGVELESLRPKFVQLRALSPPQTLFGGVCGGQLPDDVFGTHVPDAVVNGPFEKVENVGTAMAAASKKMWEEFGWHQWTTGFFLRNLATTFKDKDYPSTFTHGDLHMRNILVERVGFPSNQDAQSGSSEQQDKYEIRGLVDWETAGWYPAFWEYSSGVARGHAAHDWPECIDAFLDSYPLECSMLFLVLTDLQLVY